MKCPKCGIELYETDPGCVVCEPEKFPDPTAEEMLAMELGAHRFFAGIGDDGYAKKISGRILAAFRALREERDAAEAASEVLAQAAKNVVLDEICTCPENSPTCRMPELIEAVAAYRASKRKDSFRKE